MCKTVKDLLNDHQDMYERVLNPNAAIEFYYPSVTKAVKLSCNGCLLPRALVLFVLFVLLNVVFRPILRVTSDTAPKELSTIVICTLTEITRATRRICEKLSAV
jgi:hypothetical protein